MTDITSETFCHIWFMNLLCSWTCCAPNSNSILSYFFQHSNDTSSSAKYLFTPMLYRPSRVPVWIMKYSLRQIWDGFISIGGFEEPHGNVYLTFIATTGNEINALLHSSYRVQWQDLHLIFDPEAIILAIIGLDKAIPKALPDHLYRQSCIMWWACHERETTCIFIVSSVWFVVHIPNVTMKTTDIWIRLY